jgi:HNH endonuclease
MNTKDKQLSSFFSRVEKTDTCWLWRGQITWNGYGLFNSNPLRKVAHRWLWEAWFGDVPKGLQLDHLCRVRNCVNPAHLEPVTQQENIKRGISGFIGGLRNSSKTQCPKGHPYSEDNTSVYIKANGRTNRRCKACHRDKEIIRRAKIKEN